MSVEEHFVVVECSREATVSLKESVRTRDGDHEIQLLKDVLLRFEDLRASELVLANLQELVEVGRVDLLVFCRNPECRDTNQVQLTLVYPLSAHVLIDQEDGHVEGLRQQAEFAMHVDDPLN